jgi:hypothetical protein
MNREAEFIAVRGVLKIHCYLCCVPITFEGRMANDSILVFSDWDKRDSRAFSIESAVNRRQVQFSSEPLDDTNPCPVRMLPSMNLRIDFERLHPS